MTWVAGTVAATKVKTELAAWIAERFGAYSDRLTGIKWHTRIDNTAVRPAGVVIEILTGADTGAPWPFAAAEGPAIEDRHRIVLNVTTDEVAGGKRKDGVTPSDETVLNLLKVMLTTAADKTLLSARGVYNTRVSPEAQAIDGVEFQRPVEITCTTDTYIS